MAPDYPKFANMIRSLRDAGFEINNVDITADGHIVSFVIGGFSKSGTAHVEYEPVSDMIKVHTRYDRTTIIDGYDDLVYEAWYWYTVSKDKGFDFPDQFLPDFIRLNLVKKVVIPERIIYQSN
jgi:hypothetical protein